MRCQINLLRSSRGSAIIELQPSTVFVLTRFDVHRFRSIWRDQLAGFLFVFFLVVLGLFFDFGRLASTRALLSFWFLLVHCHMLLLVFLFFLFLLSFLAVFGHRRRCGLLLGLGI